MSEQLLAKLIESRLQLWADEQEISIAFENMALKPAEEAIYARVKNLPATTVGAFLEGAHRALTGLYQVSVIGPKGKGAGAVRAVAISLGTRFPHNLVLTQGSFSVQITTPVSIGPSVDDPEGAKTARFTLPCSFQYRADIVS